MAIVALLVAACSDPSSSQPSATSATGGTTNYSKELAFSQCVRSDGVPNFPDPQSNGSFVVKSSALGVSQSVVDAAEQSCSHLLPNGGQATSTQQEKSVQTALLYAKCMRAHGVPNYPDPQVSANGSITISGPGLDPNSPQFQAARRACKSLRPSGLNGYASGLNG
jgi:hypothetical protein